MNDDRNRWREIPCFWVGRSNIIKRIIYSNGYTQKVQSIDSLQSHEIFNGIFTELEEKQNKTRNLYGNPQDP